jgi:transposase
MAGRRTRVLDVREMVRRFRLQESDRVVAHDLGANRRTVIKYRKVAREAGWLDAPELPSEREVATVLATLAPQASPHGPESCVEPHRATVVALRARKVEMLALWQILRDQHGFTGSYSSIRRFVARLEPRTPEACVRIETAAGEEAQVDFGYAGEFVDSRTGALRRSWAFVMTLSFSRHQYVELVFDQTVETWIGLHVRAFEFFGGVPRRIVPDNLKAAVVRASFHDPEIQRSYRELAEHYGFTVAPCRPATPEHKGKVESGVHYVKRNALAGRSFANLEAGNGHLRHWIMTRAGMREHGTTREAPLARFEMERPELLPLPVVRYEPAVWKVVKLHPDCHVSFEKSYYSAPHRLIGRKLLLRAAAGRVEIYHEHERVASHPRAPKPGTRATNAVHYPPTHLAGFLVSPVRLREQAAAVGAAAADLVGKMLEEKPVDRLRAAQGVLNLLKRYGPERLEAACRRALVFGEASYRCVSSILRQGLEFSPLPPEAHSSGPVPKTSTFARSVHDIAQGIEQRRIAWN